MIWWREVERKLIFGLCWIIQVWKIDINLDDIVLWVIGQWCYSLCLLWDDGYFNEVTEWMEPDALLDLCRLYLSYFGTKLAIRTFYAVLLIEERELLHLLTNKLRNFTRRLLIRIEDRRHYILQRMTLIYR